PFSAPTPSATPPPPPPHRPPLPLRDALPISARREPYASPPACRGETLFFARAGGLFGGAGSAGFGGPGFFGGVGGAGLGRVGVGRFHRQAEQPAAHGGQVGKEGVVSPKDAPVHRVEGARPLEAAAPLGGLGVQQLPGGGRDGQVEGELLVGLVLGVHHAQQALAPAPAQPGV